MRGLRGHGAFAAASVGGAQAEARSPGKPRSRAAAHGRLCRVDIGQNCIRESWARCALPRCDATRSGRLTSMAAPLPFRALAPRAYRAHASQLSLSLATTRPSPSFSVSGCDLPARPPRSRSPLPRLPFAAVAVAAMPCSPSVVRPCTCPAASQLLEDASQLMSAQAPYGPLLISPVPSRWPVSAASQPAFHASLVPAAAVPTLLACPASRITLSRPRPLPGHTSLPLSALTPASPASHPLSDRPSSRTARPAPLVLSLTPAPALAILRHLPTPPLSTPSLSSPRCSLFPALACWPCSAAPSATSAVH